MHVTNKGIIQSFETIKAAFPERTKDCDREITDALTDGFDLSILKLSRRGESLLRENGIHKTRKLWQISNNELYKLPGMGRTYVAEVKQKVNDFYSV